MQAPDGFRVGDHSSRMRLTAAGGWPDRGRLRALWEAISTPPGLYQHRAGAHPAFAELFEDLVMRGGAADHRYSAIQMLPLRSTMLKTILSRTMHIVVGSCATIDRRLLWE